MYNLFLSKSLDGKVVVVMVVVIIIKMAVYWQGSRDMNCSYGNLMKELL